MFVTGWLTVQLVEVRFTCGTCSDGCAVTSLLTTGVAHLAQFLQCLQAISILLLGIITLYWFTAHMALTVALAIYHVQLIESFSLVVCIKQKMERSGPRVYLSTEFSGV